MKTRLFFDLEFTGLHQQTTPISIGLVSEAGQHFYAEFNDYEASQCDDWIQKNVIERLKFTSSSIDEQKHQARSRFQDSPIYSIEMRGNKEEIRKELTQWLNQFQGIEWVSDVCHYDFVLLIEILVGHALHLPPQWSACCYDLNQALAIYYDCGVSEAFKLNREQLCQTFGIELEEEKHNALYDAKVIRALYLALHE